MRNVLVIVILTTKILLLKARVGGSDMLTKIMYGLGPWVFVIAAMVSFGLFTGWVETW